MSEVVLNFQPAHAAIGGAILGVATVGKLLLTGRILGISGSFKGTVVDGDLSHWRFAFIGGLLASGECISLSLLTPFGGRNPSRPLPLPRTPNAPTPRLLKRVSENVHYN